MQAAGKSNKLVIAMVGLPARGKTYISRKINRYLNWLGFMSKVFNIGNYRRELCGTDCKSDFFDPKNEQAVKARDECALRALNDMLKFLTEQNGEVGVYDGTNTTKKRRKMIIDQLQERLPGAEVMWIESICNDEAIIQKNIKLTKLGNPDYQNKNSEEATQDFVNRIRNYKDNYQPIENDEGLSYIKIIDIGKNIVIRNIHGYLQSKLISYLMNLHIYPRPIYISRHGESVYNQEHRIGGDCALSEQGLMYADQLAEYLNEDIKKDKEKTTLLTSTLKRAITTTEAVAKKLGIDYLSLKTLDELNVGICDGLTYIEVATKFPQDYEERKMNKLTYRYPRGESYLDLISRIEPIIYEIERCRSPVIVVAHQAILRCIYAYFHENEVTEIPTICLPLHNVIKLVPETYYCKETRISIDPESGERHVEDNFQIKKVKSFIEL